MISIYVSYRINNKGKFVVLGIHFSLIKKEVEHRKWDFNSHYFMFYVEHCLRHIADIHVDWNISSQGYKQHNYGNETN